jgi:HPt (histidine-containing phosphotransfer) domain-containing protein
MAKLDLSYYKNISNNNPTFLKKLMELFINSTPKEIDELIENTKNKNFVAMYEISHKLKALFKSYNSQKITGSIIKIEEAGKNKTPLSDADKILEEIKTEFEELREEMKILFSELNSSPEK